MEIYKKRSLLLNSRNQLRNSITPTFTNKKIILSTLIPHSPSKFHVFLIFLEKK